VLDAELSACPNRSTPLFFVRFQFTGMLAMWDEEKPKQESQVYRNLGTTR
jgi:hypothetical protein